MTTPIHHIADPLRAALDAAREPGATIESKLKLEAELKLQEPVLIARVAAGDYDAAGKLTATRLQLRETLPADIAAAHARLPIAVDALWDEVEASIEAIEKFADSAEGDLVAILRGKLEAATANLRTAHPGLRVSIDTTAAEALQPVRALRAAAVQERLNGGSAPMQSVGTRPPRQPVLDGWLARSERRALRLLSALDAFQAGPGQAISAGVAR